MMLLLFLLLLLVSGGGCKGEDDPPPIVYPGQVNIGLLADLHGRGCGPLAPHAVRRAMAAVWAAHQANFGDPAALNIGVYIYDTCGSEEVAARQAYRMLGHVVQDCDKKTSPPLIAVISDAESVRLPLQLLSAFSVPVVAATRRSSGLSTAPSAPALARGCVSVLHRLRLLEVGVVAGEESLFAHFSAQVAHVTGMQATHVQDDDEDDDGETTDDTLEALGALSGKVNAVVFLVSSAEALSLLRKVEVEPQVPWLIVTPEDISAHAPPLAKVLLFSPESSPSPSFDEYFQQLLHEDTVKYHPLLVEYNNATAGEHHNGSDVSSVTRAVWSLSAALAEVQRRSCRRGAAADCRPSSADVGRALVGFDHEGALSSIRYALKGFTEDGQIAELGFYSDDEGLHVDPGALLPLTAPPPPPTWNILEERDEDHLLQILTTGAVAVNTSPPPLMEEDPLEREVAVLHDDLQSVSGKEDGDRRTSSNMISLTSHQETEKHEEPVRRSSVPPLSAWLGRPWSLAVLGTSAFVALATLYVLVFLLVKACEGGSSGSWCWLAVLQLLALLCLCCGAALHTWKPAPLVCGLRRVIRNMGLVFCYGTLLLKGMCLRSRSSLGLGGSVNRGNLLLTLVFVVGVQGALESQEWWRPLDDQECARERLASHAYPALLLLVCCGCALSTRRLPYSQSESRSLLGTSSACALVFACWFVSCWLLPSLRAAAPASLLATALAVLLGVFLPQLVALHRRPSTHQPLVPSSYADSLSTVFTLTTGGGRGTKKTLLDTP